MGFEFPSGQDLMSKGDNVLQINALAAANGIDAARFSRTPPAPFDFDTWKTPIVTTLGSGFPTGWTNVPEGIDTACVFICYSSPSASWCVQELIQYGSNPIRLWRISRTTAAWNPWVQLGGASGVGSAMASNAAWQTRWISDTGGIVSTGGKAAFALRLDHGWTNIKSKLRAALLARGIVAGVAMNSRTWGEAENSGATQTEVNDWVAAGEFEILNHSATHAGGMDVAGLVDEVVNGRLELEAQLPAAAPIWGFAPPGVQQGWDGFGGGNIGGWTSPAAEIILASHAYSLGYVGGPRRVLDGTIRQALSHVTLDEYSMSAARTQIDAAIAERRGIQFMLHPRELDQPGKITTAQFLSLLDYIVAKRDAGDLVFLSPGELVRADATPPPAALSWGALTGKPSTFPPATHTHADLVARLAVLEYDSGERDITSLLPGVVSGALYVQRAGSTVWLDFRDLVCTDPENSWHSWSNVLPPGLRPNRSWEYLPLTGQSTTYTVGPVRVGAAGDLVVYGVTGQKIMRGLISFPTPDTPPSSPPGSPA